MTIFHKVELDKPAPAVRFRDRTDAYRFGVKKAAKIGVPRLIHEGNLRKYSTSVSGSKVKNPSIDSISPLKTWRSKNDNPMPFR